MNEQDFKNIFQGQNQTVFATYGPRGINAVPVSVIRYDEGEIILFNFFMDKTIDNIQSFPFASLLVWNGTTGIQLKGEIIYETNSEVFKKYWHLMQQEFPTRTLKGVIRLHNIKTFDISLPKKN